MEFNYEGVSAKRKEHKSLSVVGAVFGTVHLGLVMAADAVNSLEGVITEKITKGDISYSDHKEWREINSCSRNIMVKQNVRVKLKNINDKSMELVNQARIKANLEPIK